MPRSRGSELPQRQSPRAPLHLKTTACSETNGAHQRSAVGSPKLDERRSSRSPLHEKKRGTRVAELEVKLSKAQEELNKLREQLASTEVAKNDAQLALEAAKKQVSRSNSVAVAGEKDGAAWEPVEPKRDEEELSAISPATDVFEVVVPSESENKENENGVDADCGNEGEEVEEKEAEETKKMIEKDEENAAEPTDEVEEEEQVAESEGTRDANTMLIEEEKEMAILVAENAELCKKVEAAAEAALAKEAKAGQMEEELRESRARERRLGEELAAAAGAKEALESEMRRLRVQSDQWRKAAEAAAAVLAAEEGGGPPLELEGRRVAGRCGSMDKHHLAPGGGGGGYGVGWGSPMMGEEGEGDGMGLGKRRGAGIRMFGDLWKKKGQHK